ncbi:hypothetical protein GKF95_17795 [Escherichia coli]|nr:hypothetical protein [Escherichia coli]
MAAEEGIFFYEEHA